jgi:hypothetical protein
MANSSQTRASGGRNFWRELGLIERRWPNCLRFTSKDESFIMPEVLNQNRSITGNHRVGRNEQMGLRLINANVVKEGIFERETCNIGQWGGKWNRFQQRTFSESLGFDFSQFRAGFECQRCEVSELAEMAQAAHLYWCWNANWIEWETIPKCCFLDFSKIRAGFEC